MLLCYCLNVRLHRGSPVLAPPPPPPPAAERLPPAPKSQPTLKEKAPAESRGALLASIRGFNSAKLKSVDANDRSDPKLRTIYNTAVALVLLRICLFLIRKLCTILQL